MKILDIFFPYRTYRRLIVSTLGRFCLGSTKIRPRLVAQNWELFGKYRRRKFECNICGASGFPLFDFPDLQLRRDHHIGYLRETLQCKACGATMRHRALATILLRSLSRRTARNFRLIRDVDATALNDIRILDTDAFSPISRLLKDLPGYFISSFRPDIPFNTEIEPQHINVNLERMGFPDCSFDIVLTSDVMEHVRDIESAHSEVSRILKPGGQYIFTVPYDPSNSAHRILVDTSGDRDIFLVPPHYHGDPLTGGILAYRVFGQQIFKDMMGLGLPTDLFLLNDRESLIEDGDVFVASKPISDVKQ